jgi:transcriptional regulator NrdR family protein
VEQIKIVEPISAYHKECPNCGSKLFSVVHERLNKDDSEESKADKVCHCCGKKFMVLFGC